MPREAAPSRYRQTLTTWAAQFIPAGTRVVSVTIDQYTPDETYGDGGTQLDVRISVAPPGGEPVLADLDTEVVHATLGDLLTSLFAIEAEQDEAEHLNPEDDHDVAR